MSLENQVTRVSQGMKDTLKTLINKLGGNVTDELIDQYPSIASALDDVDPAGSAQQALRDAKSYTDQKILEIPTPDVSGQIGTHNADASAHADIRSSISNHTRDTDIHVTAEEKAAWDAKLDSFTETDPTVPAWAKAQTKPTYTASEVGADASGAAAEVQSNLDGHKGDTTTHITAAERTKWNGKQDKLTFDAAPTANSTNPVTSGGVYTALANKLNKAGDGSSVTAAFTAASSRTNIATGEKLSVLFGKIAKWLSDLGSLSFKSTVAKTDLASDVQTSLGKADSALQSVTKSDVGLGNVDNVKQYSASNPPPYPVTSVNGQTGAVTVQSGSETNSYTATLLSNGWAAYGKYKKQTVAVTGLKESYPIAPVVDAQLSGVDADGDAAVLTAFAAVNIVQTAENQLIAYCIGDAPSTNIPLIINTWG